MSRSVIPIKVRREMETNPEYTRCALQGHLKDTIGHCQGRITREHAIYFAGKKLQEEWSIPPICAKHHGVDLFQDGGTCIKEIRVWVALNRATDEELFRISKVTNYLRERDRLNAKYGPYVAPPIPLVVIPTHVSCKTYPKLRNPKQKVTQDEFTLESKRYAKVNGISVDEARVTLEALV